MALINKMLVGESLVGEGNEVAHIDLLIGPRGSAAETAFANALVNNKDGFTTLLAVVAPNLLAKPNTILFNKVTIKGAKQAVQMFGPAQAGVAKAVADSVAEGVIPVSEADDLFICVGVFIHWDANDDKKIQEYNYLATKESIARAEGSMEKAREAIGEGYGKVRTGSTDAYGKAKTYLTEARAALETSREKMGELYGRSREVAEEAYAKAKENFEKLSVEVKKGYAKVKAKVQEIDVKEVRDDVVDYVRRNPGKSILIALGVGFAVGYLVRRREP